MNGKIVGGFLVSVALIVGIAVFWLQEYAYYAPASFVKGSEISLTLIESGMPEPILADRVEGIDADSSPLRFRACFHTPLTQAMLTETYKTYEGATPLIGPSWFDCFDADKIGMALDKGEAIAFLSEANITHADLTKDGATEIDRVVAVFPDGSAYAWHQIHPGDEDQ